MEKNLLLRRLLFLGVVFFLISPFLYIIGYVQFDTVAWDPIVIDVIAGALVQSLLSTLLTIFVGILGAFGLVHLSRILKPWSFQVLSFLIVLPSFMPPLIVIVLGVHTLGFLPMGLMAVVFFHSLMNVGLVSLLVYSLLIKKASGWLELATVEGVSLRHFVIRGLAIELRQDFLRLGFYFLILYFFSFSIPLMLGGLHYGGLEVFVYEQIVVFGNWGDAIQYSLGLFVLILICTFALRESEEKPMIERGGNIEIFHRLNTLPLSFFALAPVVFLVIGFLHAFLSSIYWIDMSLWWEPMRGTLIIGLVTGSVLLVLFSLMSFSFLNKKSARFFMSLVHPGWVIVGFSFLLMPGNQESLVLVKIGLALSILYFPYLFRLSFFQSMKDVRSQVMIAQVFPVSWWKIYREIIFPQLFKSICFISALGGLWACGDFALSGILVSSSNISSLALDMKLLISNYRLEQAVLLLIPLLISSLIVFTVFQGLYFVSRRKV